MLDKIALVLTIIGGINWGLIGLFQFDLVAWIFGGQDAIVSRVIYTIVALASIWCISLLFHPGPRGLNISTHGALHRKCAFLLCIEKTHGKPCVLFYVVVSSSGKQTAQGS